eukprot:6985881-Pyramimonas_sp.AAC.2
MIPQHSITVVGRRGLSQPRFPSSRAQSVSHVRRKPGGVRQGPQCIASSADWGGDWRPQEWDGGPGVDDYGMYACLITDLMMSPIRVCPIVKTHAWNWHCRSGVSKPKRSKSNPAYQPGVYEKGSGRVGRVYRGRPQYAKERIGFVNDKTQTSRDEPLEQDYVQPMEQDFRNQEPYPQVLSDFGPVNHDC